MYRSAPTLAQQAAPQSAPALQLGPLERFARDGTVTDVVVTCDGAVWVDCGRGMQLAHTAIPLHDPHVLRDFAVRLCAQLGCRLDESQPIADASAPDGTRVHAVVAPIVPHGASVSIRFPDRVAPDLDVLARLGIGRQSLRNTIRIRTARTAPNNTLLIMESITRSMYIP